MKGLPTERCLTCILVVLAWGLHGIIGDDEVPLTLGTCSAVALTDGSCQADNEKFNQNGQPSSVADDEIPNSKDPHNNAADRGNVALDENLYEAEVCQDEHEMCEDWADIGECDKNPDYMHINCALSCNKCITKGENKGEGFQEDDASLLDCKDEDEKCETWAQKGECRSNPQNVLKRCKRSCYQCPDQKELLARGAEIGVAQLLPESNNATESSLVMQRIQQSLQHIEKVRLEKIISKELLATCRNDDEQCTLWALEGECEKNPSYMHKKCAPACLLCQYLDLSIRCPAYDSNVTPGVWQPGDLNAMFERLSAEPFLSQYQVQILSRDPWVITMENVIDSDEASRLIELGSEQGFQRSTGVGKARPDGSFESKISESRTSSNSWCHDGCANDPIAATVIERLSSITQIPKNNSESLQMLKYEVGEYYKSHHDFIEKATKRQQGVRILTMYLYLNDVEAGGGTMFNNLNITVMPKRGRAVLWPSVLNDSPHKKDDRTVHEALPVEAGVKYGTNAWFHQYDYQTPYVNDCAG